MARLLQVVGVAALLAWTGIGAAAWMLVKDRLQITVTDGAAAVRAADDPMATLSGQVENLQNDVRALSSGIGQSLENLAAMQAEEADNRSQELSKDMKRSMTASLDAIRSSLQTQQQTLLDQHARLDMLAKQMTSQALPSTREPGTAIQPWAAETPTAPSGTGVTTAPATPPAVTTEGATEIASAVEPAVTPESPTGVEDAPAPAPKKRKSFLAISLPSEDFAFDDERSWQVIPDLSRVGFDAKSTLHDFTGVTSKLTGSLTTNLAQPNTGATAKITVDATGLNTGLEGRDEAMAEHLGTKEHPKILFAATSLTAKSIDRATRTVKATASGTMTIHGVEKTVSMPVTLSVDKSLRLSIEGQMPLTMSDYQVEPPSQLGMIKVEDEVKVWINLKARLVPRAKGSDKERSGR